MFEELRKVHFGVRSVTGKVKRNETGSHVKELRGDFYEFHVQF